MMQMHVHAQYVWYHSRCVFFPHKYMHISSWHTKIRRTCSRTLNRSDITRERESTPQRTCARACVLEEVLRIFVFHELMCIYLWGKKTHLEWYQTCWASLNKFYDFLCSTNLCAYIYGGKRHISSDIRRIEHAHAFASYNVKKDNTHKRTSETPLRTFSLLFSLSLSLSFFLFFFLHTCMHKPTSGIPSMTISLILSHTACIRPVEHAAASYWHGYPLRVPASRAANLNRSADVVYSSLRLERVPVLTREKRKKEPNTKPNI